MSNNINYRPDIVGLRAFAVILVMGFHFYPSLVPSGFIGVDIFFVISGYLITSILLKEQKSGKFSIGMFYARRIKRIFPALIPNRSVPSKQDTTYLPDPFTFLI